MTSDKKDKQDDSLSWLSVSIMVFFIIFTVYAIYYSYKAEHLREDYYVSKGATKDQAWALAMSGHEAAPSF